MADERRPLSTPRQRAVNLLRVVQNLLQTDADNNVTSVPSNSGGSASSSTVSVTHSSPSTSISSSTSYSSTLQNFRHLFAPYASASYRTQTRFGPPKRRKTTHYVPKETWTHEFFCLADCSSENIPSRMTKLELQFAGLGRKKIVLGSKDNAVKVKEKLEEAFPKLKDGGGFEVLRSGPLKRLLLLKPPLATGYSVKYLRDDCGLGQALAYIRPLQRNLNISPVDVPEV